MNTVTLIVGLIQVLGAVAFCLMIPTCGSVLLAVLYATVASINSHMAAKNIMESLFGDDGFFPLFAVEGDDAK